MVVLTLVITIILFVVLDIVIRIIVKKITENQIRRERKEALEVNLKLDYSHEAKTLKRVEVKNAKAKILAVDDEEIILDSFRKILVLDGYCVDTVQTGQEVLGLIQKHHYDFVFVDLKMPEMDGVEVCKSVKHLRPDIDVVIITGYASVETAVETMKFGAMDYVQKPFTEDELLGFVKKSLIKRQDRIKSHLKPKVHIFHVAEFEQHSMDEFAIPGGVFISEGHCWASLQQDGSVKIGIDDFAKKLIGRIDSIELPNLGMNVKSGQTLFSIKQGKRSLPISSPISGQVRKTNNNLLHNLYVLDITPYGKNWICVIDADDLDAEITCLKIGKTAVSFYQGEIERFQNRINKFITDDHKTLQDLSSVNGKKLFSGKIEQLNDKNWKKIVQEFFIH